MLAGSGELLGPVATLLTVAGLGLLSSFFFQASKTAWAPRVHYVIGFALTLDYIVFWLGPMVLMGALHKQLLLPYVTPLFDALDTSPRLRCFAERYIYQRPKHSDFMATQILFLLNFAVFQAFVWYMQLTRGRLDWWVIVVYNLGWVGLGARNVGTAYAMAHKEGHCHTMYKPWIRNTLGNVFENWLGLVYGGVPNNFSTTHIALHHRLDSGQGDTLYCWDIDRTSVHDHMMYQCRGLLHMSGFGALRQFCLAWNQEGYQPIFWKLARGVLVYWVLWPATVLWLTRSFYFWFFIILQPLVCMSFFLALLNMGFHAFIQNDERGHRIQCVESITLLGGQDDFWGENDHAAHHYHTGVYWRDLPELHAKLRPDWAHHHASVFFGIDIFSFSLLVLFKAWPLLAERYVDLSGKLNREEIASLLRSRAERREMAYREILPAMPPRRPRGYGPEPERPAAEGSAAYKKLMARLLRLQLSIAGLLEMGLPPVGKTPSHYRLSGG